MSDVAGDDARRSDSLWDVHAQGVARLGALVEERAAALDEITIAEGYRHLARVLYMGLLATHEYADTDDPTVFAAKTRTQLTGGVTSDAVYHEAFIDGARSYRLSGRRGTAELMEINSMAGKIGITDTGEVVDSVREDRLAVGGDGRYELTLSPQAPPEGDEGRWLRTVSPEGRVATYLLIRQYSTVIDAIESATFDIEPVDGRRARPPLSTDKIARDLGATVDFTEKLVNRWADITDGILAGAANEFVIVRDEGTEGLAMPTGHRFAAAGFRLDPDQAWVVRIPGIGRVPYAEAPYWGFQICNYWFEPIDYGATWAHVNKASAAYDENGSITIVVSERDPGRANWLQLRGHTIGSAHFRLSRSSLRLPEIATETVDVDDLIGSA